MLCYKPSDEVLKTTYAAQPYITVSKADTHPPTSAGSSIFMISPAMRKMIPIGAYLFEQKKVKYLEKSTRLRWYPELNHS